MPPPRKTNPGQIIAGASIFCAFTGVMIAQNLIPGGMESMAITLGGGAVGFVVGLVGAVAYIRRQ